MKAVVIHDKGGPDQLVLADMPDLASGPGESMFRQESLDRLPHDLLDRELPARS